MFFLSNGLMAKKFVLEGARIISVDRAFAAHKGNSNYIYTIAITLSKTLLIIANFAIPIRRLKLI